ncbi:MAG TPA: UDP-N-acetylglucosamine 2-epimerase [Burkholderiales bacterium]|nr:UDP-N-acetylglucosamine 2-epimerase [Burkholderiales bacterium]
MIHFAIGTKAQFIKMAPLMHLLQTQGRRYHLLDLSQHGGLTGRILSDFDLAPTITRLRDDKRSVETYLQAALWLGHGFRHVLSRRTTVKRRLFLDHDGVVLLHGDTLSTLMGLHLARAAGLPTALVEAGLTSERLLDPFPEEAIRRYVSARTDYLFAPDDTATAWLTQRRFRGETVNTSYNTGRDALDLILARHRATSIKPASPYGVVTLHRLETLSNRARLYRAIEHILALADTLGDLHFYLHPPTENALKRIGLYDRVRRNTHLKLFGLAPYSEFVTVLNSARYILTDGGSIQEEASYLDKPCLILRNRTERRDGLNRNAIVSTWNIEQDAYHLRQAEGKLATPRTSDLRASRTILDALRAFQA